MDRRISALVVEDSFFLAIELKDHLEDSGFDVIGPTSSLATARIMLERHTPDIVLLDINMGTEGLSYDLASYIRSIGVPFLFITGYDANAVDATDFDQIPLLVKPVDLDELVELIEQACCLAAR